jgi:hypothetical protein
MKIVFAPRGILQIDDAKLTFKNFAGRGDKYNREGDRNFAVVIPQRPLTMDEVNNIIDIYKDAYMAANEDGDDVLVINGEQVITIDEALKALGWNVKIRPPKEEGGEPFCYLSVKVKVGERGLPMYLVTGNQMVKLDEESMCCLDDIFASRTDLDIRPYDWEMHGNTGRSAYLQSIKVTQQEFDRFASDFAREEFPFED